ncbi:FAD-binding [Aphelenchoides avenae]|nr:FAD-binding [Aphelenchus avenae]
MQDPEAPAQGVSDPTKDEKSHVGLSKMPQGDPAKELQSDVPSLTRGAPGLSAEANLRVPVATQPWISSTRREEIFDDSAIKWQNGDPMPGAVGSIVTAQVSEALELSPSDMPKPKRGITLALHGRDEATQRLLEEYDAGDSVYFIFPNPKVEVDLLLDRLGLLESADLQLDFASTKEDQRVPSYVPSPSSARYIITHCLDIRRSPGRPVLRVLADYATDPAEKRRLLELCSAQGTKEFTQFVRQAGISLVDLLIAFPSVKPTLERLIELLPRLLPRPYSIASYKTTPQYEQQLRFAYSLLKFPAGNGIQFQRYGVCSGWMQTLAVGDKVQILLKEPSKFRLPPVAVPDLEVLDVPLLLIGPGTGIAPFISFLEKLSSLSKARTTPNRAVKRYVIYGSRNLEKEFLFMKELEAFRDEGLITDLVVCESGLDAASQADNGRPRHFQDAIKRRGQEIVDFILSEEEPQSLVFACGDGKGLSKDVWACFSDLFQRHLNYTPVEAIQLLTKLRKEERFIEDVWS